MESSDRNKPPVATGYPAHNVAGTAYPYPPPPIPNYYPPPPQQPPYGAYQNYQPSSYYNSTADSNSSNAVRRLIRFFIIGIIVFLVASGVIILITYLVLRPKLPTFSVTSGTVSSFSVTSSQLTSNFDFNISMANPNKKMSVYYDTMRVWVFYGTDDIAMTSLPPLTQSTGNSTVRNAKFAATGAYVGGGVVDGISKERNGGGVVGFRVRISSWVVFKDGGWRTRGKTMKVYCDDVRIGFSNATATVGSLVGGESKCDVDY